MGILDLHSMEKRGGMGRNSTGSNGSCLVCIDLRVQSNPVQAAQPHRTVQCLIKHLNLDLIEYLLGAKNSKLLFINDIIIKT